MEKPTQTSGAEAADREEDPVRELSVYFLDMLGLGGYAHWELRNRQGETIVRDGQPVLGDHFMLICGEKAGPDLEAIDAKRDPDSLTHDEAGFEADCEKWRNYVLAMLGATGNASEPEQAQG